MHFVELQRVVEEEVSSSHSRRSDLWMLLGELGKFSSVQLWPANDDQIEAEAFMMPKNVLINLRPLWALAISQLQNHLSR